VKVIGERWDFGGEKNDVRMISAGFLVIFPIRKYNYICYNKFEAWKS